MFFLLILNNLECILIYHRVVGHLCTLKLISSGVFHTPIVVKLQGHEISAIDGLKKIGTFGQKCGCDGKSRMFAIKCVFLKYSLGLIASKLSFFSFLQWLL